MFVLKAETEFDWPVKVKVPEDGKHVVHEFTCRFRLIDAERMKALTEAGDAEAARSLLGEAIVGWGNDVADEDGKPIPFSSEALDRMLHVDYVFVAIAEAYHKAVTGKEYARKN